MSHIEPVPQSLPGGQPGLPCRYCGAAVTSGGRLCEGCAPPEPRKRRIAPACRKCATAMRPNDTFCRSCGEELGANPAKARASACTRCGALALGTGLCRRCGGTVELLDGPKLVHPRDRMISDRTGRAATFGSRLGAFLIDGILVWVVSGLLLFLIGPGTASQLAAILTSAAYYIGFWSWGASPGKLALGIHIVRMADGEPPGIGLALVRYVVAFVSGVALLIGYLWMLWDKEHRTWHDRAASVAVIYR
jgi:uncharacterized RDD family membrane protein YckC